MKYENVGLIHAIAICIVAFNVMACSNGDKERTIRTVQKEIGIEAYRKQGTWYWHMPEPEEEVDEE